MEFFYSLQGFSPPFESGLGFWGFEAWLKSDIAFKLRNFPLNKIKRLGNLQKESISIIKSVNLDYGEDIKPPYVFVKDSFLLHSVRVPGNACDLSLRTSDYSDFVDNWNRFKDMSVQHPIVYVPHNVDNKLQQYCLAFLWINWANIAGAVSS